MADTTTPPYVVSRNVGEAVVTAISDGSGLSAIMRGLLVPREEWRALVPADGNDEIILGYNVAHIRLGAASVLIDLGFDDPSPASQWRAPRHQRSPGVIAALATLGVRPEEITHVAITHAHGDHIAGGSVERDGRRVPRYPNARHFLGRADWEGSPAREQPDSHLARHIGTIADAGLLELVDAEREIAPGITMLPAPGESPGHCIVRVRLSRGTLLLPRRPLPSPNRGRSPRLGRQQPRRRSPGRLAHRTDQRGARLRRPAPGHPPALPRLWPPARDAGWGALGGFLSGEGGAMERRSEHSSVSRSRLRIVALVVALAVLAGVIAVAAVAVKRVFDNAIIVDAWPMPTDATAIATDNGIVGNRWTAWHGLPLPVDVVLLGEHPSGSPYAPNGAAGPAPRRRLPLARRMPNDGYSWNGSG